VHFKAGVEALEAAQWQTAYREFRGAYAITPRWTILGNLGIAAWHLERDGEAIEAMEQYLVRGGHEIEEAEASKVRATIERIRASAATVAIEAAGEFRLVDTRTSEPAVVNEYGPFKDSARLHLRPGQHTLELLRAGVEVPVWTATLLPGDVRSISFVIPPPAVPAIQPDEPAPPVPATDPRPDASAAFPTASWVLWGAGTAMGITAGGFVWHARGIQQEADRDFARQCPTGATGMDGCERTTEGSKRAARWRTAALGTGLGALGALVTGTVLYFIRGSSSSEGQASELTLQPWLTGNSVGVSGSF
jgi:hypothetical protein